MLWCGAARVLVRPRSIFARSLSSSASYVELPQAWAATYEASSQEELLVAYRSWAPTYDTDSIGLFGYRAPARTAEVLSEKLEKALGADSSKGAKILDVGAGTGLVGERLVELGHDAASLAAADLSPDMLEVARRKGCYLGGLFLCDLEDEDAAAEALGHSTFEAAVAVGTFTPNHAGTKSLDAMVRAVQPGGLLCFSLRDDFQANPSNGFQHYLDALVTTGVLEKVGETPPELYTPKVSEDISFRVWTYAVGASGIRGDWKGCS